MKKYVIAALTIVGALVTPPAQANVFLNQPFLLVVPNHENCSIKTLNRVFVGPSVGVVSMARNLLTGTACFVINPITFAHPNTALNDCLQIIKRVVPKDADVRSINVQNSANAVVGIDKGGRVYCIGGVPITHRGYADFDAYGIGRDGFDQLVWKVYFDNLLRVLF